MSNHVNSMGPDSTESNDGDYETVSQRPTRAPGTTGVPVARAGLADGRARVIRLTTKGRRLEQTIYAEAGAAELRIAEILGPQRFAHLHGSLELLTEQLTASLAVP